MFAPRPPHRSEGPLPWQILSNGEFEALPQTPAQQRAHVLTEELAEKYRGRHGLDRRGFLRSAAGLAAAFLAMNTVYGSFFQVDEAEAADPEKTRERSAAFADQFIFDNQLHFVHDDFSFEGLLDLREHAAEHWNPKLKGEPRSFELLHFENFLVEVFAQSDTTVGLLSGAPADKKQDWFLSNDQLAEARAVVSSIAGWKRLLCHAVIAPGMPGWMDEIDRAVEELKPDSWKGYTIGDPLSESKYPWRLDDEKLIYPAYEKMQKAGIRNVCIHKGLLPPNYKSSVTHWKHAMIDDLPKAAKDWPGLNFIIYHAAMKPLNTYPDSFIQEFEKTGRIEWVTELAELPEKYGVSNVYGEIGTAFASGAVAHPHIAAALLGTLIKGMGVDHVLWGTDSIWYGSPQWQIEALRRIEIPEEMREKHGFEPLGDARSPVKEAIIGTNGAVLYGIDPKDSLKRASEDGLHQFRAEVLELSPIS